MSTWLRALPQKEFDGAIVTMPDSATDYSDTDSYLFQASFTNKSAGSVTISVLDKQTSPKTIISSQGSLPAGGSVIFAWPQGLYCKGGIRWVAGAASAIDAQLYGFKI